MTDPKLDADLRDYLAEQKRARVEGNTISSLRLEVHESTRLVRSAMGIIHGMNARLSAVEINLRDLTESNEEHGAKLVHHAAEIVTIKRRLRRDPEDEEMATGRFDVKEIQREVQELQAKRMVSERARADEVIWWKRTIVLWIAGILAFVATSTITILITMAIAGKK